MLISIIGFLASSMSIVLNIPQAIKTFRYRNDFEALRGVSVLAQCLLLTNALLWFWYAFVAHDIWIGLPGVLNIPLALLNMRYIIRARKQVG